MTATLPNPQTAEDIAPSAITANDIFETYKHRQITLTILGSEPGAAPWPTSPTATTTTSASGRGGGSIPTGSR